MSIKFKILHGLGVAVFIFVLTISFSLNCQIPPLIFPEGAGVNIHFTRGHTNDLDMIANAGFKFIRMDFSWGGTERKKGEYDFSAYDELTANLEKRGLRAIYILDYSNGLYEDTFEVNEGGKVRKEVASPQKPESVAAFARWAAEAAKHFKGRKIIWEIWNEPNIFFWKPKPDVQKYITLAKATIKEVRAAVPDAVIIAPASSEFPWKFLEEICKAGLIEGLDGISVHPYRGRPPETVDVDYARLRSMIEKYASPQKRNIPIISGEWGYATHTKGISLETQAAYIVRQQLVNLMNNVPISIWYDWKNDGTNPDYNEDNFGTVTHDLRPKPSYIAMQNATKLLNGCKIVRRLDQNNPDIYNLLFNNEKKEQKLAIWTVGKPENVEIKLGLKSENEVKIYLWDGTPVKPELVNGVLKIQVTQMPQYIFLLTKSRELAAAAAWEIEQPLNTVVVAGGDKPFQLPVIIKNPFDYPILVNLSFKILDDIENRSVRLSAGKTERLVFKREIIRRDLDILKGELMVEYQQLDGNKESVGRWTENFNVSISNPIKFEIAPIQNGTRIIIENPYKSSLVGTLNAGKYSKPISINNIKQFVDIPVSSISEYVGVSFVDKSKREIVKIRETKFIKVNTDNIKGYLDGDSKVPAKLNLTDSTEPDSPFENVKSLEYTFESGWRFIRVANSGEKILIEGKPVGFGVWVYGDNSSNILRMRIIDSQGQTFQPNGPAIDWSGWKWIKFDLANLSSAGHWGGMNDGVVRGNLKLDTLLILDGGGRQTSGKIKFCGFSLIYEK